jgi:hypothetical protein
VGDVDPRSGGAVSLRRLIQEHGALPDAPRSRTGTGGAHIFFRATGRTQSRSGAFGAAYPGVDVKGEGGYVILPPSNHIEGTYVWRVRPDEVELPPWPGWLLELLAESERASSPVEISDVPIPPQQAHDTLRSWIWKLARSDLTPSELSVVARALNAMHNDRLPETELRDLVASAVRKARRERPMKRWHSEGRRRRNAGSRYTRGEG